MFLYPRLIRVIRGQKKQGVQANCKVIFLNRQERQEKTGNNCFFGDLLLGALGVLGG